ncbi:hypothetical protein EDC96DRAFT_494700 [Choanephora cucurbitarum]|nr:hypothetical protein EDC96DRAFT_494700 [Choanephora cucurbitarum]
MRRRLLKQAYQNQFNTTEYEEQSLPAAALKPLTIEAPEPKTIQPSKTLLKKNKNKKKNHLTDPKADNQVHIHYEDANWDQPPAEPVAEERNHHGRAFISYAEADSYYKGQPHETEYPIHRVPTLFYAEDATVENNTVSKATAEVDYENLPDADFKSKIPAIGDQLAIKTLELTANYSPEISEWKQVVLRELNLPETVTVEFKQGFYHNQTKGGKFDNKAHERRDYDDYFYQQEEEDEVEDEEERIVTLSLDNIFAVKKMST